MRWLSSDALAATIVVPADYQTITEALHAASYGDTVQLVPRVYDDQQSPGESFPLVIPNGVTLMKHPDVAGKPAIRSYAPGSTVIAAMGTDSTTVIQDLTINGTGTARFGIGISGSPTNPSCPRVLCCDILYCSIGVWARGNTCPEIDGCWIGNHQTAAIRLDGSTAAITYNIVGPMIGTSEQSLLDLRYGAVPSRCVGNTWRILEPAERPEDSTRIIAIANRQPDEIFASGNYWPQREQSIMDSIVTLGRPSLYNSRYIWDLHDDPSLGRVVWWSKPERVATPTFDPGRDAYASSQSGTIREDASSIASLPLHEISTAPWLSHARAGGRFGGIELEDLGSTYTLGLSGDVSTWIPSLRAELDVSYLSTPPEESSLAGQGEQTIEWKNLCTTAGLAYGIPAGRVVPYGFVGFEVHVWRWHWKHKFWGVTDISSGGEGWRREDATGSQMKMGLRAAGGAELKISARMSLDGRLAYSANGGRDFLSCTLGFKTSLCK